MKKNGLWILVLSVLLTLTFISCTTTNTVQTAKSFDEDSPVKEEYLAKIDAIPDYSASDTWVFYFYICGSDLEDRGRSSLSDFVSFYLMEQAKTLQENKAKETLKSFTDYLKELNDNGMDLPDSFYKKNFSYLKPPVEEDDSEEYLEGAATRNLRQLFSVKLPDNVKFVIQTGGAHNWDYPGINPNRTQRWLFDSNGLHEVESLFVQNMGDQKTLSDFIAFADSNYPADHKILLFWDHGGAYTGAEADRLFGGDLLSLKEITDGIGSVYKKDLKAPPLEAIGFDCCLMANTEVANELSGYAKYLYASEEAEPGLGWDYKNIAEHFIENTGINGAKLGKIISDDYLRINYDDSIEHGSTLSATFSVTDLSIVPAIYSAYADFAKKALEDAIKNPRTLSTLSTQSNVSTRYCFDAYKIYNVCDLGNFMTNLSDYYPEETSKVLELLDQAMLYVRNTYYLSESTGLTIYYPTNVEEANGLAFFLSYINEVCKNQYIKDLYTYKVSGFLKNNPNARKITTDKLKAVENAELTLIDNGNMKFEVPEDTFDTLQDAKFILVYYEEETDDFIYFGEDAYVNIQGGTVQSNFNGVWATLGGINLPVEVIENNSNYIKYRSHIFLNSQESWLQFAFNYESKEYTIFGVTPYAEIDNNTTGRSAVMLKKDDVITPIYEMNYSTTDKISLITPVSIVYKPGMQIEECRLQNGIFYEYIEFTDIRGNKIESPLVSFEIDRNEITNIKTDSQFRVVD